MCVCVLELRVRIMHIQESPKCCLVDFLDQILELVQCGIYIETLAQFPMNIDYN